MHARIPLRPCAYAPMRLLELRFLRQVLHRKPRFAHHLHAPVAQAPHGAASDNERAGREEPEEPGYSDAATTVPSPSIMAAAANAPSAE